MLPHRQRCPYPYRDLCRRQTKTSVSDDVIVFHRLSSNEMYELEFIIYHLTPPYGITELPQNLHPDTVNKSGDSPDSVAQNTDPAKFVGANDIKVGVHTDPATI